MQKNEWHSRRWQIVFISEKKYNPYINMNQIKNRPVLVWSNAQSLKNKVICFYCSSQSPKDGYKHFCFKAYEDNDTKNKQTWINLSKIFFVKQSDINWNQRLKNVRNQKSKEDILDFMHTHYTNEKKSMSNPKTSKEPKLLLDVFGSEK